MNGKTNPLSDPTLSSSTAEDDRTIRNVDTPNEQKQRGEGKASAEQSAGTRARDGTRKVFRMPNLPDLNLPKVNFPSAGEVREMGKSIGTYQPVLMLILTSLIAALVLYLRPDFLGSFMPLFMGISLVSFAMLKLFDLEGFKAGFSEYDLITMRYPAYGYWYPIVELCLGLGFLFGAWIALFAFLTIVIMSVTAVGIILALVNGKDLNCACTGALTNVPLGSISLVESIGMALMSLFLFARAF